MTPEILETACEWRAEDVADPARWTETLSAAEIAEVDDALAHARDVSSDMLDIGKDDFPLPTLGPRLKAIDPRYAARVRLDNASLLARLIYSTGLPGFERVYESEGRDVRRALERIIRERP